MSAGTLRKVPHGTTQHNAIFTHVMVTFLYWREIYVFHFNAWKVLHISIKFWLHDNIKFELVCSLLSSRWWHYSLGDIIITGLVCQDLLMIVWWLFQLHVQKSINTRLTRLIFKYLVYFAETNESKSQVYYCWITGVYVWWKQTKQ
jgi:hypothetical protein